MGLAARCKQTTGSVHRCLQCWPMNSQNPANSASYEERICNNATVWFPAAHCGCDYVFVSLSEKSALNSFDDLSFFEARVAVNDALLADHFSRRVHTE